MHREPRATEADSVTPGVALRKKSWPPLFLGLYYAIPSVRCIFHKRLFPQSPEIWLVCRGAAGFRSWIDPGSWLHRCSLENPIDIQRVYNCGTSVNWEIGALSVAHEVCVLFCTTSVMKNPSQCVVSVSSSGWVGWSFCCSGWRNWLTP